ncbi:MAG: YqgE/AlgH family protein [Bacteroidota bacterium]|nr:YqgE/AlgH family protein [Bacteroidota bacterium]
MIDELFSIENQTLPQKGRVLISEPFLDDYYFKRSIVLLTEHNQEGSIGFVINNPVEVSLNELLPDFPDFKANVSIGGPVGADSIQFIHTLGDMLLNAIKIKPGLYWGGNFEQMKSLIQSGQIRKEDILFFIGYSGWSPNQLDDELTRKSWIVTELSTEAIMSYNKDIWKNTLKTMGKKYRVWVNFPDNPGLN